MAAIAPRWSGLTSHRMQSRQLPHIGQRANHRLDRIALQCKVTAVQPNWAEENLQVIRTLMERAALYRRTLAPTMLTTGVIGLLAAVVGRGAEFQSPLGFLSVWIVAALAAATSSFFIMRRQAVRAREPFFTTPTRRVIGAMHPPLTAGALLTLPALVKLALYPPDLTIRVLLPGLVCVWLACYGCGLNAAGQYSSRGVRILGWAFIGAGSVVAMLHAMNFLFSRLGSPDWWCDPHSIMGLTFGGFHLIAGIYLYFTEKREPTP